MFLDLAIGLQLAVRVVAERQDDVPVDGGELIIPDGRFPRVSASADCFEVHRCGDLLEVDPMIERARSGMA